MHLKELWSKSPPSEIPEGNKTGRWDFLLSATDEELIKQAGKKEFENALKSIAGMNIEIRYGEKLEGEIHDLGVKCTFLPFSKPGSGICTCKKNSCLHEVLAILKLQVEGSKRELPHIDYEEGISKENIKTLTASLKDILRELMITGLEKISIRITEQLEALAIESHNSNIPRLEKELRALKTQIELYLNKHSQFNRENYLRATAQIYGLIKIIENYDGSYPFTDIAGIIKSKYMEVGSLSLTGVGARYWKSQSEYTGITAYFLDEKRGEWFTYTYTRPGFYEGNNFNAGIIYNDTVWNSEFSIKDITRKHITLNKASRNSDGRLSSSQNTRILAGDFMDFNKLKRENLTISQWPELLKRLSKRNIFFREKENSNLFFLKFTDRGNPEFDEIKQEMKQPLYDDKGNTIYIKLPFLSTEKPAIKNLELLYNKKILPIALLGHVYLEDGFIYVLPVSVYLNEPKGLYGNCLHLNLDEF